MPTYLYRTSDGETVEHVCDWVSRPDSITLPDAREAHYDFAATVSTVRAQSPAEDRQVDALDWAVHPKQVGEYNQVANEIGLHSGDAHWDERGRCHMSRAGRKKLDRLRRQAKSRADDPEFKPDRKKGLKV
jgi:hypothetical protein